MDVFKKIETITDNDLHPKFKLLRDAPYYAGGRAIIEDWVTDFHDRDNKIAIEFQKNFHSAFWEFYLHAVFKKISLNISNEYNRPDFIIEGESGFYVEAVVSEIKNGGAPESQRTLDDHFNMLLSIKSDAEFSSLIDEAIARHSNSILYKMNKYTGYFNKHKKWIKGYKECEWVDTTKPYVIALASFDQINYGKEFIYSMLALLYGLYYSPESKTFTAKENIIKPGTTSTINLGIFNTDEMMDVSAIIFTNTLTLGKMSSLSKSIQPDLAHVINVRYDFEAPHFKIHEVNMENPEHLLDGLYVFRNPNAKIKFDCNEFNKHQIFDISLDNYGLCMEGQRRPIVTRYCSPMGHMFNELLMSTAASEFNEEIAYEFRDE